MLVKLLLGFQTAWIRVRRRVTRRLIRIQVVCITETWHDRMSGEARPGNLSSFFIFSPDIRAMSLWFAYGTIVVSSGLTVKNVLHSWGQLNMHSFPL